MELKLQIKSILIKNFSHTCDYRDYRGLYGYCEDRITFVIIIVIGDNKAILISLQNDEHKASENQNLFKIQMTPKFQFRDDQKDAAVYLQILFAFQRHSLSTETSWNLQKENKHHKIVTFGTSVIRESCCITSFQENIIRNHFPLFSPEACNAQRSGKLGKEPGIPVKSRLKNRSWAERLSRKKFH